MRLPACLVALLAAACSATSSRAFSAADATAVRKVLDGQRDAWNRGDLEGYMAGYERSEALVFTSGGHIRRGWANTLAGYVARYGKAPATMGTLSFDILDVRGVGADGAVVLGRWRLSNTAQAGGGVFTVVLERIANSWRVVHDHTTLAPATKSP